MTIQLRLPREHIQALPSLSQEGLWSGNLSNEDTYDTIQDDVELKPLQQQYTSLRDLIVVSPTKGGPARGQEVEWCDTTELKFKDNLLKLAARAYLQPMGKVSTPEMHFIEQCWMTFTATNRSLVTGFVESLQRQADACIKFLRAQTFNLIQLFKPHQQVGSLQGRLS